MKISLISLIEILLFVNISSSQIIPINDTIIFGCGLTITDTGLDTANYGSNELYQMTICAPDDSVISIYFDTFLLYLGDLMIIIDPESPSDPIIGSYGGQELSQETISGTGNCLTIFFSSNSNGEGDFSFDVLCAPTCSAPVPIVTVDESVILEIYSCPDEEIIFDASSSIFSDGTSMSSFQWDFGDGFYDTLSWPLASHLYETPGAYNVYLTLTDDIGCSNNQEINLIVLASNSPLFNDEVSTSFCLNFNDFIPQDSINLLFTEELYDYTINVENLPFQYPNGNAFYIPDDQTNILSDSYIIEVYSPDSIISNYDDMPDFCVNMEHTYMGDLTITFICPNGQTISVHQQGGGTTNLGTPNQGDGDGPGVGLDYCWAADATNGTWATEANSGILPSDVYSSAEDFSSLIGCPTTGVWTIQIADSWGADDGYVFGWSVSFDNNPNSSFLALPPIFGLNCDSTYFTSDYFIQNEDCSFEWIQFITEPGTYPVQVTTTNDYGCLFSDTINFILSETPLPIILQDLDFLYTEDGMNSYQWFFNSAPLLGSNSSIVFPSEEGEYTVLVINENDCFTISDPFNYVPNSVSEINTKKFSWRIDHDYLIITADKNKSKYIQLLTSSGKLIVQKTFTSAEQKINISNLASGIYFIRLDNVYSQKIIITN